MCRCPILSLIIRTEPRSTLFPYTTLFRSHGQGRRGQRRGNARRRPHQEIARWRGPSLGPKASDPGEPVWAESRRSEEHTSELQSQFQLVCRLLLENKRWKSKGKRGSGLRK